MPAATKNSTLQEDKPSLRITLGTPLGGDSRQRNEIVNVGAQTRRKSKFFMKFRHLTRATVQPCKPWPRSNFFYILWIELRFCMRKVMTSVAGGKMLLTKTNWFFHKQTSTFQKFSLHSLHLSCHSTCPLTLRVLLSKRQSRLYESLVNLCGGRFASAKRNRQLWCPNSQEKYIFH